MKVWSSLIMILIVSHITSLEVLEVRGNRELAVGVVDRIEGEMIVVLLEERAEELLIEKERLNVPAQEGSWLLLLLGDSEIHILNDLPILTEKQRKQSLDLLEKLQTKEY